MLSQNAGQCHAITHSGGFITAGTIGQHGEEGNNMKKNVGGIERVARVVLGIAVLSLTFVGPKSAWAYLGIIPLVTGLIGWCPPYALFGFSTCNESR